MPKNSNKPKILDKRCREIPAEPTTIDGRDALLSSFAGKKASAYELIDDPLTHADRKAYLEASDVRPPSAKADTLDTQVKLK